MERVIVLRFSLRYANEHRKQYSLVFPDYQLKDMEQMKFREMVFNVLKNIDEIIKKNSIESRLTEMIRYFVDTANQRSMFWNMRDNLLQESNLLWSNENDELTNFAKLVNGLYGFFVELGIL